ncbi:MAG: hypothetical protein ACI9OH_000901 [Oleispira sp.]|jgi:hypothetical protein
MMNYFSFVLLFCSFSLVASDELVFIQGTWDCSYTFEEEGLSSYVSVIDDYNVSSLTYTSVGSVEVSIPGEVKLFKISFIEAGTFSYINEVITAQIKNLDVNLEFGDLTPAELNDLRQDVLAENQMYKTVSLNSKEWIAIDLVDNTESVCKKI